MNIFGDVSVGEEGERKGGKEVTWGVSRQGNRELRRKSKTEKKTKNKHLENLKQKDLKNLYTKLAVDWGQQYALPSGCGIYTEPCLLEAGICSRVLATQIQW